MSMAMTQVKAKKASKIDDFFKAAHKSNTPLKRPISSLSPCNTSPNNKKMNMEIEVKIETGMDNEGISNLVETTANPPSTPGTVLKKSSGH